MNTRSNFNPIHQLKSLNDSLRVAHLSDPHFSHVTYNPTQLLSKRWIGNFNLLLFRKKAYYTQHLWHLPELIHSLMVDTAFITGDFSSTSQDAEFSEAQKFLDAFKTRGVPTYILPGNHDCYIQSVEKNKLFYSFFPSENLRNKRVESHFLGKNWWYIGLDCAVATPPFCSYGEFSEQTEKYLEEILQTIPSSGNVIIGNHFPLFTTKRPLHDLKRADQLQLLLSRFKQVKIYLHGHDHEPAIIDKQSDGFPLVLNSGSCAHKPNGTFYIVDLTHDECLVQRLLFRQEKKHPPHDGIYESSQENNNSFNNAFSWVVDWQRHYEFRI